MKILRHEEFEEGCNAACNGPYDGKWSKTMVGYGDEDNNFVVELTYNYGIRNYPMGNDYNYLKINSNRVIENIKQKNYPFELNKNGNYEIVDSNGYKFLVGESLPNERDLVTGLSLFVTDLDASEAYWSNTLKGHLIEKSGSFLCLSFDLSPFRLLLEKSQSGKIDHAKAYGRIAFSCPTSELKTLQDEIDSKGLTVLTRYVQLDTPGKATVCVVILADPDGHEICFVGDEGFRELSRVDPNGQSLLNQAMENDKSDEWHLKKNKQ
jgi:catechol 2,3-dioxygenase-like lactoylglutathione lyase family enzyme